MDQFSVGVNSYNIRWLMRAIARLDLRTFCALSAVIA